ncbi:hypothetical protein ACFL29_01110 [Patescibacteria group bacterium]
MRILAVLISLFCFTACGSQAVKQAGQKDQTDYMVKLNDVKNLVNKNLAQQKEANDARMEILEQRIKKLEQRSGLAARYLGAHQESILIMDRFVAIALIAFKDFFDNEDMLAHAINKAHPKSRAVDKLKRDQRVKNILEDYFSKLQKGKRAAF